jgi:SAM-dependent methyltransferase
VSRDRLEANREQSDGYACSANRRNWEERARIHARSPFYDLDAFARDPERIDLHDHEVAHVGDVRGRSLVHLQCHLGSETLSWARLGASKVAGLDFAQSAIEAARGLAARCGLADRATFVVADVHDAETALAAHAPFDVVYVSVGALCWLPDVARWARIAAALIAPGGILYLHEVHPMANAFEERDGELVLHFPYFERMGFERSGPIAWNDATTYGDPDAKLEHAEHYEWPHGVGEIVQAVLDAGLSLELFHEHPDAEWRAFPSMTEGADGLYRLPAEQRGRTPLTFSLRARKRS